MIRGLATRLWATAQAGEVASTSYVSVASALGCHRARAGLQGPAAGTAAISTSHPAAHGHSDDEGKEKITVTFIDKDEVEHTVQAPVGVSLMEVAHANDIELEGACEGSLACSTCHVIVEDEDLYHKLPEPCEDELDMLDLAFGLTETSRLGCQVIAAPEIEGIRVRIPSATRNMYVDGHVPKPH